MRGTLDIRLAPAPGFVPGVGGPSPASYQRLVEMTHEIRRNDPTFAFDVWKPVCDELWNLLDGSRTLGEVRDIISFQFGVDIPKSYVLELAWKLVEGGQAVVVDAGPAPEHGR
jgi:hypothetical protein